MADTEEALGKVKWGGLKIGERRIYSLAYTDDMVLLAEGVREMRSMMEGLRYTWRRKGWS